MTSDWQEKKWGDLITLEYGKSLKGYKEGNGKYQVFGTNGPIGWTDRFLTEGPGIIIGRKGAYRGVEYSDKPFFVIDTAFYVDPKVEFDMLWAYYQMLTIDIDGMDSGSAIPSTSRDEFYQLPVLVPPIDEQKEIANQLKTIDQKIHLNQQTNETLEAMAQAIFKSWFVDFDPVRAKIEARSAGRDPNRAAMAAIAGVALEMDWDEIETALQQKLDRMTESQRTQLRQTAEHFPDALVESEIGVVPKGWEVTDLTKCLDRISKTYNLKETEEVIFLNTGDIEEGKFLHNKYSKTKGLPGQAKKSIQKGDILYSEIRPKNKRFAYVYFDSYDFVVSTKLMVLRSNNSIDPLFYYQILKSESTIKELQILAESRSGTFPQITYDSLKAIEFILPNKKEILHHFTKVLKTNFKQLIKHQKQNETLAQLRDTLLPKLISGEVGV
jgi:type I restriction enzyme, S subunit